jgi:transcriptional regulator with XRE-family HTH domain
MSGFAETLKAWRGQRRLSQLALAGEAGVSVRHIAFIETGRARPSAGMVLRLAEAMDLPLSARNHLLTQAGFAPRYPARGWDDPAMAPVRAAVAHMLDRHAPWPGIAIDRLWRLTALNPPGAALFGAFGLGVGGSLLDLMLGEALPAAIENWPQVAAHAARRLRTESAALGGEAALDRAAARLAAAACADAPATGPVVPTVIRAGDVRLSLFATIATFGTPEDATLDAFRVELFFPADDATADALAAQAGAR